MKKACIVGYGSIGPIHAAALEKHKIPFDVCDCDNERLKKSGSHAKFTDFNDVLNDSSIDVVHICTPHFLHISMALDALKHNKHVVLEKPVGINRAEAEKLFNYNGNKEICIMLQNRTNPSIIKMKELIDNNAFGKPITLNAFLTWNRNEKYYAQDSWRGKWSTEGGGLMINQAVHTLDLLCWLGGGYESMKGGISTHMLGNCIEVEDTADAIIKTKSGMNVCFYATNCSPINSPPRIEAVFENCVLRYGDNMLMLIKENQVEILANDSVRNGKKSYWGMGHQYVIKNFYDYLDGNADDYLRLENAHDVTNALFDLYEQSRG